jgi:hypothetical protein
VWGTFSVADHRRRRPFVADVLLYDRLVVPVPDGADEAGRWRSRRRDPDLQKRLLNIIGDLAVEVPWSLRLHDVWAARYADQETPGAGTEASVWDDVTRAVEFDANNIELARRNASPPSGSSQTDDPDDPGWMLTRMVLVDEIGSRKDRALVAGIPRVDEVEAVVAYGSYHRFEASRGPLSEGRPPETEPVVTFRWPFFVPSGSHRTDGDLLREAVELAHADEIGEWRAAVQRWRRDSFLRGQSDAEALSEMEELIRAYAEAARKRKILIRSRWAFAVVAAAAGAAAALVPPVGIPAALFGLGALLPAPAIPKRLEAAAMFHQARRALS